MRPHNRAVMALVLLGALATYADAPRLAGTMFIGSVVNFAAATDGYARAALMARVHAEPQDGDLAQKLHEGERSRAVVEAMPGLPGVLPVTGVDARLVPLSQPPRVEGASATGGMNLDAPAVPPTLAIPPPPDIAAGDLFGKPFRTGLGGAFARPPPSLA